MSSQRIRSIDIFRALTMLLMIFVNDLWTLHDIPGWLGHKSAHDDGMGLADVVFPAFLFIVGLSIPHAINTRLRKGDSNTRVLLHILERSFALLLMGVYMVNLENISREGLIINRSLWEILMTLAFFLIWNNYSRAGKLRIRPLYLKAAGWLILVFLAIVYEGRGGDGTQWMRFHWWGILGLIGWGYLLSALVYLGLGSRPGWITLILVLLLVLNVNEFVSPFDFRIRLVVSASNYASVMAGVLVTTLMLKLKDAERMAWLLPSLTLLASVLFLFGFLTRPEWGISKIMATPSWTAICAGISILSFMLLYLLADRLKISGWAKIIEPAGTSTLTCYLVPYFAYPLWGFLGWQLPDMLTGGAIGIIKSILFALLIIQVTGLLGKLHIRLKI
ncbi:MAG: heparan-alpha-glucosaminide N-acetyltransferase domain-containing protein [Bacteroidales bacterium]